MSFTAESGRLQILDDTAAAAEQLAAALGALGEAYDHLDEQAADRLEAGLFRPLQAAYGELKRSHDAFAGRYDLPRRQLAAAAVGLPSDPRLMLRRAAEAVQRADEILAGLQDSLLPVEVGDEALRAGLSSVRRLMDPVPAACSEFERTLGR